MAEVIDEVACVARSTWLIMLNCVLTAESSRSSSYTAD
jgi:hypothetical protein